jgi:hypothetical protein
MNNILITGARDEKEGRRSRSDFADVLYCAAIRCPGPPTFCARQFPAMLPYEFSRVMIGRHQELE